MLDRRRALAVFAGAATLSLLSACPGGTQAGGGEDCDADDLLEGDEDCDDTDAAKRKKKPGTGTKTQPKTKPKSGSGNSRSGTSGRRR